MRARRRRAKQPQLATPRAWLRPEVIAASLAINVLALAVPLVVLQTYDRLLPNAATETLAIMLVALAVVIALDALLRAGRAILLAWCGVRFEHAHTLMALDHLLHVDLAAFENEPKGTYLEQFQGLERIREFYHGQSILMLVDLPFVFLFLWLIYTFAGAMVLVPLSVIALFLIVSLVSATFLRRALHARATSDERRQNFLIESLQGIHTLKSLAMEPQMERRYERLQGQSAESLYTLARVNSVIQGLGVTFSQAVMVSFVGIGAYFAVQGVITIGALAAGTMLAGRVLQPALKAMGMWTQLQSVNIARDKFNALLDMPSEAVEDRSDPVELRGEVELVDVHFRHPGAETELLTGVSLHVMPGEVIGITGRNGSGKSTLLDLIMGFDHPSAGQILLDGRDLRDLDRSSLRAQIGLVPQRGVLFAGTLLENMTLFREGRAVDDAITLIRQLGMESTITRLAEGLDTQVGGGIVSALSEGFRQRIIMVRALIGDQRIMLFDDANAAFDQAHDEQLIEVLKAMKGGRTMFIVSHRPSLLRLSDRVFELEDGALRPASGAAPGTAPSAATSAATAVATP